jgi:hypothetical protein
VVRQSRFIEALRKDVKLGKSQLEQGHLIEVTLGRFVIEHDRESGVVTIKRDE